MAPFNAYVIKRQAHTLSRRDTDQRWNLFRHVSWDRRPDNPNRTGTWAGGDTDLEMNVPTEGNDGNGSPITHATTGPAAFMSNAGRGFGKDDVVEEDAGEGSERDAASGKENGARNAEPSQESSGNATYVDSQQSQSGSPVDGQEGLRARPGKQRQDTAPESIPEENEKKEKPKKNSKFFKHLKPSQPFTVKNQLQRTFLNSWINILLLAAPVGIAINYVSSIPRIAVFVINFLAIIPLAAMLSFATEEIALRTGETLGGLLNATFGNAVELIVAVLALIQGKVLIVQTSLIGSVLSNLLLVMGMCFFFGGLRRQEQFFNTTVAQTAASLLALAVAGVIIPTVFDKNAQAQASASQPYSAANVAMLSRGTAVILLVVYGGYLFFQLKTHASVFAEESKKVPMKPHKHELPAGAIARGMVKSAGLVGAGAFSETGDHQALNKVLQSSPSDGDDDDDHEDPQLHFFVAIGTLAGSTVIIAFCAEFMVDGIGAVTAGGVVSEEFVGLILLPIVGNAAEHVTAVTVAMKDKMDLAIGVAVGSSMQVALFLIPLLVVIGWGLGNIAMTLSFDMFQVAVLFVAVLLVNYLISDGKSHWLEGLLLMCLYCIIAVCSWWYPAKGVAG